MTRAPGIYPAFDAAEYHQDPCPTPSLSASLAKIILAQSPAHARLAHPRLNPSFVPSGFRADKDRDIGTAFHSMMLGVGRDVQVILADDWRTKDAKEQRDEALAAGKVPLLEKHYVVAQAMVDAASHQLVERGFGTAFDTGSAETAVIARVGPDWFRALIDWYTPTALYDYKTTGNSAAPDDVARKMVADGWPIQAAMQEFILNVLEPEFAGRREHLFVVQENYEPYALTVVKMSEAAMTWGRNRLRQALGTWSFCMESGTWPAYPLDTLTPEIPAWLMGKEMSP
jgi:hypothetical protein